MTAPALVKAAELKRMATIAKQENVTVWVEVNGKRFGVSPDTKISQKDIAYEDELRL